MKQVEVQIMGQSYLLGCPDGGETRLREAVEKVDGAMCRIRDAGKVKARDRIAVLAALNLAFDLGERLAAQPPAPAPAPARARGDGEDLDAPAQERLAQLLRRLDSALGEDGRLI